MSHGRLFGFEMPSGWLGAEECWQIIEPFADAFCAAVKDAHDQWPAWTDEQLRGRVQAKDRGTVVTSLIWASAQERLAPFMGDDGPVQFCPSHNVRKFIIADKLAVRIKTVGQELLVMRTRSPQDDAWYTNLPIEGFPEHLTRINIAFRSVPAEDRVRDIHLTWQATPKEVGWSIPLAEGGMGTLPMSAGPKKPLGGPSLPMVGIAPLGGVPIKKKGDDAG